MRLGVMRRRERWKWGSEWRTDERTPQYALSFIHIVVLRDLRQAVRTPRTHKKRRKTSNGNCDMNSVSMYPTGEDSQRLPSNGAVVDEDSVFR